MVFQGLQNQMVNFEGSWHLLYPYPHFTPFFNVQDLFNLCGRQFSIKTVLLIAIQLMYREEMIKKYIEQNYLNKLTVIINLVLSTVIILLGSKCCQLFIILKYLLQKWQKFAYNDFFSV